MPFSMTATIDQGRAAEQLRKRTAAALEKRAQMMAAAAEKEVVKLIKSNLKNHNTGRGLTPMASMPFRGTVDSGGDFPIVVSLHCDASGEDAAKFGALNNGARGGLYVSTKGPFTFIGKKDGKKIVTKSIKREAYAGNQFLERALAIASAGVYAGFQFTRSHQSGFATGGAPRRRRR